MSFATPVLGNLTGQVFFATGTASNPLRLFIQINVAGLYEKLSAANGFYGPFIVSTLTNLPQVPFTSFALSFSGGPNALVTTPPCGTDVGIGAFTPWSGTANQVVTNSVTISQTSSGAGCAGTASKPIPRNVLRALARRGTRLPLRRLR